jgi:23S rRNA pseudouridine2605 synthase
LESEGLIFVTNDGDLTHILTHPTHEVEKEYDVLLDKAFSPDDREKLLKGFRIEHGYAKCEGVEIIKADRIRLVLRQGLKRQIRLMLYKLGYEVERLFRIRIGPILIEGLARGAWRFLSQKEVAALRDAKPSPKPKSKPAGTLKPRPPAEKIYPTLRSTAAPKKSARPERPPARKKVAAWDKSQRRPKASHRRD